MERKGGRHLFQSKGGVDFAPYLRGPLQRRRHWLRKQRWHRCRNPRLSCLFPPELRLSPPSTMCKPDGRRKTGHHHHHQSPARDTGVYHRLSAARLGVGRRTSTPKNTFVRGGERLPASGGRSASPLNNTSCPHTPGMKITLLGLRGWYS